MSSTDPLSPANARHSPAHRLRCAAVMLALVLLCRSTAMLPVFRDELQQYLGIGDGLFGLLFSVGMLTGLATILAGGALVDRWGPFAILRIGFAGVAAAMALIALAGGHWVGLAFALGVNGLFARPMGVAVSAYLVRLFPGNQRRALSLNLAAGSMTGLIFPSVAEGLLRLTKSSARFTFGLALRLPYAVAGVVILAAALFYRRPAGSCVAKGSARRWRLQDVLPRRQSLPLLLLMGLHGAADSMLHIWMARFLGSESFATRPIAPGFVLSAYAVAYLVSRVALAGVPERRGRWTLMIVPGLAGGGALIAGILTRSYLFTALGYVLGAFLWSAEFPVMLSMLAHETEDRFGAAMAMQQMVVALLAFIGLNAMGLLVARVGGAGMWKAMLVPAGVFPCIGLGAAIWMVTRRRSIDRAAL